MILKGNFFYVKNGKHNNQSARALYTAILEGLKLEAEDGMIEDLTDTDTVLIIITVNMVIISHQ